MSPEVIFTLFLCTALSLFVVARCTVQGRIFSMLSFYSAIFFLETTGGVIKAVFPNVSRGGGALEEGLTAQTLAVAFAGYLLFLLGYLMLPKREPTVTPGIQWTWNSRYSKAMFGVMIAAIGIGIIPAYQRVVAAGGLQEFLAKAYQYRFGTFSESDQQNAVITLANIVSGCSVAFVAIGFYAWLRGGLGSAEKVLLAIIFALLMVKQASTMLRSCVLFTFVSLGAVYYSVRSASLAKMGLFGLLFGIILLCVNYAHQVFYTATAKWEQQSFGETVGNLIAPQGHFHTLAATVERHSASGETLHGEGLLESVFFFVPRVIWQTKAPSSEFGTQIIQAWLDLPTNYQMATTNVGELIAHFGYLGMIGMLFYGALYRYFDSFRFGSLDLRVGLYCMLLPRVLVDAGMGISSLSNTIFGFVLFLVIARGIAMIFGSAEEQVSYAEPDLKSAVPV